MQGVLGERRDRLFGIVNGVDYRIWDPATDRFLPAHYDVDHLTPGKPRCKEELQRTHGLTVKADAPLLGVVARLVEQKGPELVARAAPAFLGDGAQLIVLGEGDQVYHRMLQDVKARFPGQVSLTFDFNEPLAHQIEAGADLFLMPSLYEPSGLNQLYSMRYGTLPVVRATGGLADTVMDTNPKTLAAGTATGFSFTAFTPAALLEAIRRALALYREHPDRWLQVVRNAMRQDWSWDRSAAEYEKLYQRLAAEASRGR
jgi:starch synthase